MKRSPAPYTVRSRNQLDALASPSRQEIVDILSQMGTVSVAELATALGRPADAIYYHLRVLKQAGLVLAEPQRGNARHKEQLIRTVSSDLRLQYQTGKNGNLREVSAIVGSMLRMGIRDFSHAFKEAGVVTLGPGRELWAVRKIAWLSAGGIAEVNRSIHDLLQSASGRRESGRLYGITILLTPLSRRKRARSKQNSTRKAEIA